MLDTAPIATPPTEAPTIPPIQAEPQVFVVPEAKVASIVPVVVPTGPLALSLQQ